MKLSQYVSTVSLQFELDNIDSLGSNEQTKDSPVEMESIGTELTVGGSDMVAETNDSGIERSKNPTPSILINSEERAIFDDVPSANHNRGDGHSATESDPAPQSQAENKSDLETDGESDAAADHHSRLLRLLSNETSPQEAKGDSPETDPASMFLPVELPGVRLRVRSLRAKDRIPSRLFRSLQHEFDSSSEDIRQLSSSSASPPAHPASGSQASAGIFRFPHLYASVTPETPSSATSELEAFFPSAQAK